MKNKIKKVLSSEELDIIEFNQSKKDIVEIMLLENVSIIDKETKQEYIKSNFLSITNRKGERRILDLLQHIDITEMFCNFELLNNKKSKIKPIFIGQ